MYFKHNGIAFSSFFRLYMNVTYSNIGVFLEVCLLQRAIPAFGFKQKWNLTIGWNIQILSGKMYRISKNIWLSAKAKKEMSEFILNDKIDMKNCSNCLGEDILIVFLWCWFLIQPTCGMYDQGKSNFTFQINFPTY